MDGCIWNIAPEERQCEFCVYRECELRKEREFDDDSPVFQAEWYIEVMEGIVGGGFLTSCRKSEYVWARNIVAYQLVKDGMRHRDVARYLGLVRCTISHCVKSVENMLAYPKSYTHQMEIWRKFQEISYLHKR